MNRQPTLASERLLLRPLREDDRGALLAIASDPLVWEQHPIHDRWRPEVFGPFVDEALQAGGALVAIDRASGAIAGSSQFRACSLDPEEMEIGWTFFARAWWRTGFNREMKRLMLAHALADYRRVLFRIGETNLRSRKALEAIGGTLVAGMTEDGEYHGRPLRHVVYAITRADFAGEFGEA